METKRVVFGLAGVSMLAAGLFLFLWRDDATSSGLVASGEPPAPAAKSTSELERVEAPAIEAARSSVAVDAPVAARAIDASAPRFVVVARVVDADAQPIADAQVRLVHYSLEDASAGGVRNVAAKSGSLFAATSDARGAVELAFAPEAGGPLKFLRVAASKDGFAPAARDGEVALGVERIDVGDLVLARAAIVSGRVVEDGGAAIAGERVVVSAPMSASSWHGTGAFAITDASGAFTIHDAPPGRARVQAQLADTRKSKSVELELVSGERRDGVELVVPRYESSDSISGIVLDPDGAPVAHARLNARARASDGGSSTYGAPSDARGRFRVGAREGWLVDLDAADAEGRYLPATATEVPAGTHGVELRLGIARQFELVVVDEQGRAIEEFGWMYRIELANTTTFSKPEPCAPRAGGRATLSADARPFGVEVTAIGCESARTATLDPASLPATVEVRLKRVPAIRGRVLANGAAVANAEVLLLETAGPMQRMFAGSLPVHAWPSRTVPRVATDVEGRFTLAADSLRTWVVRAESPAFAPGFSAPIETRAGEDVQAIEIALVRGGAIEGLVRGSDGTTRAGVLVAVSRGDAHAASMRTDASGAFRFERRTPGGWHVRTVETPKDGRGAPTTTTEYASAPPEPIPWDCEVVDGGSVRVDLEIEDPAQLVVRMQRELADFGAWSGSVALAPREGEAFSSTALAPRTGVDGLTALLPRAGSATFDVSSEKAGTIVRWSRTLPLTAGRNEIESAFAFGSVRGRTQGVEAGTRLVYTWRGTGETLTIVVARASDGSFALAHAPVGTGTLEVESGGTAQRVREVKVKAGEVVDVGVL